MHIDIVPRCESGKAFVSFMECYERNAYRLLARSSTDDRQFIALCAMLAECIKQSNLLREGCGDFCKAFFGIDRWHPDYIDKVVEDFETNVDNPFLIANAHEVMAETIREFPSIPGCKEGNCMQWYRKDYQLLSNT